MPLKSPSSRLASRKSRLDRESPNVGKGARATGSSLDGFELPACGDVLSFVQPPHDLGPSLDSVPDNDIELGAGHVLSTLAEPTFEATLKARQTWMRCTLNFRKLSFFEASFASLLCAFLLYVLNGC
jgi:hypothetical protein